MSKPNSSISSLFNANLAISSVIFLFLATYNCNEFKTLVLNENQNKKYLLIIPLLFGFVFLYKVISKIDLPNSLQLSTYSKNLSSFSNGLKIFARIIGSVITDFYYTIKVNADNITKSGFFSKLSNILHDNHLYLYILLLIQLIIVLTIECVIN